MTRPRYIDRSGEQVYPPPFSAANVGFFGFAALADRAALQALCERYLNAPLGGGDRFTPALAHVLFVFNTIDALRAETPAWQDRGWFPEQEAAVWVLVADRVREQLFWFHPYMLVDNSYALAMGREIYGFPKSLGWFDIPRGPQAPVQLSIDTVAVRTFAPETKGERARLFGVRQDGSTRPVKTGSGFGGLREVLQELVQLAGIERGFFAKLGLAEHLFEDLIGGKMPMVFLKQFRDGAEPTLCCYQAIQEVQARLVKLHDARIYSQGYAIDIDDLASHPIRADLGLPAGPVNAEFSFWLSFDFAIGDCEIVWSTGA
jgi:hypothetical protein